MLISLHLLSLNARQFWQGGFFRLALSEHGSRSHNFRNLNLHFSSLCNLVLRHVLLYYTLNVRSRVKQFVFPRVLMFPGTKSRGTSGLEEDKLTGFPRDLTLSVLFYF